MTASADDVFTATAATYDEERARLIPGFARFYGWAVKLVPVEAGKVLDLGAGTGLLAEKVRAKLPAARLELVDISEAMLARARVRFAGDEGVVFRVADYSAEEMTGGAVEELMGGYDAVVSALSIHHLEDGAKRVLFGRVWKWLRPGGLFVNADQVLGPTAALETRYRAAWLAGVRELGATERQVEESLFRQQADRCAPVETQMEWMREAGFAEVDCWYKDGCFAVMTGVKGG